MVYNWACSYFTSYLSVTFSFFISLLSIATQEFAGKLMGGKICISPAYFSMKLFSVK